jgi:hemoglobin
MTDRLIRGLAELVLATAMVLAWLGAAGAGDTLYDDLGGKENIERFVGDTLDIAVKDPRIARDFDNINLTWLRGRITMQFCAITGGPCRYTGRDMHAAHKGLHLATLDFNALTEDLQIAMGNAGVPFRTQNRLLALLAPMYRDIVTR